MRNRQSLTKLAFEKKAGIKDIGNWIKNLFGKSYSTQNVGKKTYDEAVEDLIKMVSTPFGKDHIIGAEEVKRLAKALPSHVGEHIVEQQPWKAVALSAPIATGIGAYAYGKHRGESAKTDADISKGIKGLGSMLANPELYGGGNSISDFTSI